jgi:hypothetical protein
MSGTKGDMPKRFFVQGTETLHKRLQHLAIDRDSSAEKLAGVLLAAAVELAERDPSFAQGPDAKKSAKR